MNDELYKYFAGEMSATEKIDFFRRLQTDLDAQNEYARLRNTLAISGLTEQTGDDLKTEISIKELRKYVKYRSVRRFRLKIFKYAAIAGMLIAISWLLSHEYILQDREVLFTEINVPKGQYVNITLEDGTTVRLSPRTKMRIPNRFNRNNRTVELDGQGFFSVMKNAEKPFVVKTNRYDVKVLGTKFDVFAYAEVPKFETCIVEGSVLVYNNKDQNESITLLPNEKVSLVNNRMIKSISDFSDTIYLEDGIFGFRSKQFSDILDCLSIWYNVKFSVTGNIDLTRKISGKFRQGESIENILSALQSFYLFRFQKNNDNQYEIY